MESHMPSVAEAHLSADRDGACSGASGVACGSAGSHSCPGAAGDGSPLAVDVVSLEPSELMVLQVKLEAVGEVPVPLVHCNALVDSGASASLVRSGLITDRRGVDSSGGESLIGLGGVVGVLGRVILALGHPGLRLSSCEFMIVPDNCINFDVILGQNFLSANKLTIDSFNFVLRQPRDPGCVEVYLARGGEPGKVVYCGIPVYASTDVVLRDDDSMSVPVEVAVADAADCYYDGLVGKSFVSGMPGVLDVHSCSTNVLLRREPTCGRKSGSIAKGTFLGTLSSVVDVAVAGNSGGTPWSRDRICAEIPLGDLLPTEAKLVVDMLLYQRQVLSRDDDDIGRLATTTHRIVLNDETPIRQRPRRFPRPITEEVEKQCAELRDLDIIEPSCSPWSSPIVPIRKKDGSIRLCVDYRKLNSVTKADRFPMPNLNDLVFSLHGMKLFTTLDLVKGYYQIPLEASSRELTAFSTPSNHFQFKRLSFGLKNAPAAFQREMQAILKGFPSREVVIYIDDILIMSRSFEEHLSLVGRVLDALREHGIKVKPTKCHWFKASVPFLGHIVSGSGLEKAPEYVEQVVNFPKPETVHQLRQFLGLVNFQRKFLPHCSVVAQPLSSLTGGPKKKKLFWTMEMESAFSALKDLMAEEIRLAFPDYGADACKLELAVDASGYGAGACLSQIQDGQRRVISFNSMSFSAPQRRYSTIDRELAAIRWGVKYFKPFLFGVPFVLYTDHRPLTYMHNMSSENSRVARTLRELSEFDFEIRYVRGSDNEAADTLSRLPSLLSEQRPNDLDPDYLPSGLSTLRRVDGGGDSLVSSLLIVLEEHRVRFDTHVTIPESIDVLRSLLVEDFSANMSRYGRGSSRYRARDLAVMRRPGQQLCEEMLFSFASLFGLEVWVHCGMETPVIYSLSPGACEVPSGRVHLQLLAGCHYNPVSEGNSYSPVARCPEPPYRSETAVECMEDESSEDVADLDVCASSVQWLGSACSCVRSSGPCSTVRFGDTTCCALLDTGAQVSLVRGDVWDSFSAAVRESAVVLSESCSLRGVGGRGAEVEMVVRLRFSFVSQDIGTSFPFAVVRTSTLPFCVLLGANFMKQFRVGLDLASGQVTGTFGGEQYSFSVRTSACASLAVQFCLQHVVVPSQCRPVLVDHDELVVLQSRDFALRLLKRKVVEGEQPRLWRHPSVRRFQRFAGELGVLRDLLWYSGGRISVPVVTFDFLVEVVVKIHVQMGHIGRHKLVEAVLGQVWHPEVRTVCGDVCNSCIRCQTCKIASLAASPPVIKVTTSYPFEMVSMDLMDLPVTPRGHRTVLMIVDQFSKWLVSVPLRDKKGSTVAFALHHKVLPHLVRCPDRILTDNGPEFRCAAFEEVLSQFGIVHSYSTPYCPASNGGVERVNRTIAEILRGLVGGAAQWDLSLAKAVMVYNSTLHQGLGMTPSECLLTKSHVVESRPLVDLEEALLWREGHPAFHSFRMGQLVLRKIPGRGGRCIDKLLPRYDGPYKVIKVQNNGVSYIIEQTAGVGMGLTRAVHHRQIKRFNLPPKYLADSPAFENTWPDFDDSFGDSSDCGDFLGFPVGGADIGLDDSGSEDSSVDDSVGGDGGLDDSGSEDSSVDDSVGGDGGLDDSGSENSSGDESVGGETSGAEVVDVHSSIAAVSNVEERAFNNCTKRTCGLQSMLGEVGLPSSGTVDGHVVGLGTENRLSGALLGSPVTPGGPAGSVDDDATEIFACSSTDGPLELPEFPGGVSPISRNGSAVMGTSRRNDEDSIELSDAASLSLATLERPVLVSGSEHALADSLSGPGDGFSGFDVGVELGENGCSSEAGAGDSFAGFEDFPSVSRWQVLRSILDGARASIENNRRDSLARISSYSFERSSLANSSTSHI